MTYSDNCYDSKIERDGTLVTRREENNRKAEEEEENEGASWATPAVIYGGPQYGPAK